MNDTASQEPYVPSDANMAAFERYWRLRGHGDKWVNHTYRSWLNYDDFCRELAADKLPDGTVTCNHCHGNTHMFKSQHGGFMHGVCGSCFSVTKEEPTK